MNLCIAAMAERRLGVLDQLSLQFVGEVSNLKAWLDDRFFDRSSGNIAGS